MQIEYDRTNEEPVAFIFRMAAAPHQEGLAIYEDKTKTMVHVFYHDSPGGLQKVEYFDNDKLSPESVVRYLYKGDKISITF
jgi:hypothetical protein